MRTDRQEQLIAEYMRTRARVEVPPDLLMPVRAGIAETPQAHRSWFAALAPAGVAVVAVAAVIGLVAIFGLRPAPVGPSASASPGPATSMGQKPSLRAILREVNDQPESLTFYLRLLDGTPLYEETLTGSQLGEEAWVGPFGQAFLRLGVDGAQWTIDLLTTADPTPRRIHTDDARITALTLSPDGSWLYLSRADAAGGDDLGIWRLPVAGGDLSQVMEPDAQRPTPPQASSSVFFWTPDGSQLLVQHCRGERVPGDDCTWTAIDGGSGEALREIVPARPAGIIVGLANDRLLAGADCDGLSCKASLVDFATGEVTDVDVAGARETLIESSAGPILLSDKGSSVDGYKVTATELDSGRTWTAYQTDAPIFELVSFEGGSGGVQLDPGWFAVAMEGQLGAVHASPPILVNALTGQTFEMANLAPDASSAPSASAPPSPLPSTLPPPGYEIKDDLPISVLANDAADALFREVDTCVSAAGYTVEYPASWYTNPAVGDTPACSWFAPEPFDVPIRPVAVKPPPPDGVWITMQVFGGGAGYTSLTPIYFTEDVTVDGYDGHRAEFGHSTLDEIQSDPDYRAYWYLLPLGRISPTFIAETGIGQADDYPLAKAVLDRMVASTTFQPGQAGVGASPVADVEGVFNGDASLAATCSWVTGADGVAWEIHQLPEGYDLHFEGNDPVLTGPDGEVVARVGDRLWLHGIKDPPDVGSFCMIGRVLYVAEIVLVEHT